MNRGKGSDILTFFADVINVLPFRLHSEVFPNLQKDLKLRFLRVALVKLLNFSQFLADGKLRFLSTSRHGMYRRRGANL